MAMIPMIVWNLHSHLAAFSRFLPIAGMLDRMLIASISPAMMFVISINPVFTFGFLGSYYGAKNSRFIVAWLKDRLG